MRKYFTFSLEKVLENRSKDIVESATSNQVDSIFSQLCHFHALSYQYML